MATQFKLSHGDKLCLNPDSITKSYTYNPDRNSESVIEFFLSYKTQDMSVNQPNQRIQNQVSRRNNEHNQNNQNTSYNCPSIYNTVFYGNKVSRNQPSHCVVSQRNINNELSGDDTSDTQVGKQIPDCQFFQNQKIETWNAVNNRTQTM